jgi:hypothetical protein
MARASFLITNLILRVFRPCRRILKREGAPMHRASICICSLIRFYEGCIRMIRMTRSCRLALVLLPILAACGGGNSSNPAPIPQAMNPSTGLPVVTQSSLSAQPDWATVSTDLLYISNMGNNSITVYKHDAKGKHETAAHHCRFEHRDRHARPAFRRCSGEPVRCERLWR